MRSVGTLIRAVYQWSSKDKSLCLRENKRGGSSSERQDNFAAAEANKWVVDIKGRGVFFKAFSSDFV